MKVRKILLLIFVSIGLMTLMSTTCEKDDPDNPGDCSGIASASATGEVNSTFCFDEQLHFNYEEGDLIFFGCKQNGDPIYTLTVSVNTYGVNGDPGLLVPGTYDCGADGAGYVEMDMHGEDNEFYKSKSGSVTITEMSESTFKATFNVITEGYNNGGIVTLSGTVNMLEVNIP